ncbi:MAG: hypothetical protein WC670_05230 [Pseudolabrys sp.]|jgi:hypothetical protein
MFCMTVLTPVITLVRTLVQIVTTFLQQVCGWVTSVLSTVQQVVSQSCSSWGWFSWICEAVVTLITVVQTVTNWVCSTVTTVIVTVLTVITEIIIYIATWVCWVIDLVFRVIAMLFCRLIGKPREKYIQVCVQILADDAGTPCRTLQQVDAAIADANTFFAQCKIRLVKCDVHIVNKPQYLNVNISFWKFFPLAFSWFSSTSCGCCSRLTIFFVHGITGAEGFSVPGCDWVLISGVTHAGYDIAHEIGHLADLPHSSDSNNVMIGSSSVYGTEFTRFQCCMLRSARFTHLYRAC